MNEDLFDVEMVDNIEQRTEQFTLEDVLDDLRNISDFGGAHQLDVQVYAWLQESGLVFELNETAVTSFLPKRSFFAGAQFRITPTAHELKEQVLFAGHRFIPFMHSEKPSFLCRMQEGTQVLPYKTVTCPIRDLMQYYSLYGWQGMMQQLVEDQPANTGILLNERDEQFYEAKVTCTVFDMAGFFDRHNFQQGDSLVLTVQDWYTGQFSVEYCTSADLDCDFAKCRAWCDTLEKSLFQVFELDGILTDVHRQMSQAYFLGGKELTDFAGLSLGPYLAQSSAINIAPLGSGMTILWYANQNPEDRMAEFMEEESQPAFSGRTDSLNAIMQDMGLSSSEVELEARMRDELYQGGQSFEHVLDRMFSGLQRVVFATEAQGEAFFELAEELWDRVRGDYNRFADSCAGPGRSQVLQVLERQIHWLRSLDQREIPPASLPAQEIFLFGQITAMLETTLRLLNSVDEVSKSEIQEVTAELDEVEQTVMKLIAFMDGVVAQGSNEPVLTLLDDSDEENALDREGLDQIVYQLKISLSGAKPPIWRRVLIPADVSLWVLHKVIQELFEWYDSHLHMYTQGDAEFGDPDSLESDCVPEKDVALFDVLRTEKDRLSYIYDFGDWWEHVIVLEKVLPRDEKLIYPVCKAGRKAGPLEDSGGISGYMMLLEALKDSNHPSHESYVEWAGENFDADTLDLKEINNLFKEWRL